MRMLLVLGSSLYYIFLCLFQWLFENANVHMTDFKRVTLVTARAHACMHANTFTHTQSHATGVHTHIAFLMMD